MKILLICIVAAISFAACTKNISTSPATDQVIFFKDDDVEIENMVAVATSPGTVTLNFNVAFANNINRIELMSSKTQANFCTIKAIDLPENFSGQKGYSFSDSTTKAGTIYYLLRFKKNNYNWSYSPYLTVNVK